MELDEGGKRDFRFIRGMAAQGFLVNPLLENNPDVSIYYREKIKRRYAASLSCQSEKYRRCKSANHSQIPIAVEVYQSSNFLARSRSENIVKQSVAHMKYPMFSVPPVFVKGGVSVQPAMLEGSPGLMVHCAWGDGL